MKIPPANNLKSSEHSTEGDRDHCDSRIGNNREASES